MAGNGKTHTHSLSSTVKFAVVYDFANKNGKLSRTSHDVLHASGKHFAKRHFVS